MNTHEQAERQVAGGASVTTPQRQRRLPHPVPILVALGGRYGWRWWLPLLVWGTYATVSRLQANADPATFPFQTGAYEWFTLASLLAVLVIWVWGSRLAVSFGHRRGHVFVVTSVTTLGMLVATQLFAQIANRIEHAVVGPLGIRVLTMWVPKVFEPGGEPVPNPLFANVLASTVTDLMLILPVAVAVVVALCWGMRWGWLAILPGLFLVPVVFFAHSYLWAVLQGFARGPRQDLVVELVALGITTGVLLTLAWVAFRRTPV